MGKPQSSKAAAVSVGAVASGLVTSLSQLMLTAFVTATLNSSEAARDLLAMLPLSIRMRDHLRREKTGPLPGPLSERKTGTTDYQSGDLGYWRPGGNFVIFYRQDGPTIPSPGIFILGRHDSAAEIFDVPGNIEVTIESTR